MKLSLGISPCPNDTYILDALVNKKIDTSGFTFDVIMEDVQTLNELVMQGKIDVCKISLGTLPLVLENYVLLESGAALGRGVGPLLISAIPVPEPAVRQCTIAIPGKLTTAHVLFSLAFPEAINKVFVRYDEVEEFVSSNTGSLENIQGVKLGVIIHETRFTYEQKGLVKITDLGNYWESETGLPVPLGGIVVKRSLGMSVKTNMHQLILRSIEYSNNNKGQLSNFIKDNAREMSEDVMLKHISLYVNNFSIDLGDMGRSAVKKFIQVHSAINKLPVNYEEIFLK